MHFAFPLPVWLSLLVAGIVGVAWPIAGRSSRSPVQRPGLPPSAPDSRPSSSSLPARVRASPRARDGWSRCSSMSPAAWASRLTERRGSQRRSCQDGSCCRCRASSRRALCLRRRGQQTSVDALRRRAADVPGIRRRPSASAIAGDGSRACSAIGRRRYRARSIETADLPVFIVGVGNPEVSGSRGRRDECRRSAGGRIVRGCARVRCRARLR